MRLSAKELIQPVSDDQPCGEDLEYDPAFQQMEAMLQSKSEQEFGDTVIPGTGPDWKGVGKQAADLLKRTRDLRVLSYAAISQLHTDGLAAFKDALEGLNACLETYWDSIYPELDAEDNNDATMRFNTLQILNDNRLVSDGLERSSLVELKGVGGFSLRDIELAEGKIDAVEGEDVQDIAIIQGAFGDSSPDDLAALGAAIGGSMEELSRTAELWGKLATDSPALDVDESLKTLKNIRHALTTYAPVAAAVAAGDDTAQGAETAPAARASNAIKNRNDVIHAIDRICEYYAAQEPSSPVPILLRRAQRLVAKSFYEILEDMIPDGVPTARVIGGKSDSSG
ncbi:MAG: type VI secretion system protein TssA [Xanthomonadales bacterium]|nr:type VI secretion system protein TssA [Xanthomonadales bacterium]